MLPRYRQTSEFQLAQADKKIRNAEKSLADDNRMQIWNESGAPTPYLFSRSSTVVGLKSRNISRVEL